MRLSNGGESGERYEEAELLVDLISRRPGEFSGEDSAFAQLVLARHYGLKTRLLDISRNPLVSLYHACNDDEAYSGRLHIFAVPRTMIKPFTSDTVSIIANFAKLTNAEQELILGCRRDSGPSSGEPTNVLEYPAVMRRLYHFIMQEKPYFEERIKLQDLFRVASSWNLNSRSIGYVPRQGRFSYRHSIVGSSVTESSLGTNRSPFTTITP